ITFTNEKGRRSQVLSLSRKVMCTNSQPFRDADAFWEHRNFVPTRANFASAHSSPLAYCNDETGPIECLGDNGYCTLAYNGGKFVPICSCKWGFRDSSIGECRGEYDPYGLELELEAADGFVAAPLPGATL
ncbi:hypothetical protein PRIPAC_92027, partial [Pristionchus pacificus]|uniref:Uncharacterized protein n=1 Tax=Pristionchus pacificus TaxID=54126 RepID=A0A2A6CII9_PRIPA